MTAEVPTFKKEHYGAIVATIHENDHECLEVMKRQDGRFEFIVHNRRPDSDRFYDLSIVLKPEQVSAIGRLLEAAKRYDETLT